MDFVRAIANLDESPDLHAARLLILIDVFVGGETGDGIEGLTKLAKLDFLLRYPVLLERALKARNKSTRSVELEEHERYSVESEMVRYRFGPWDHKYRRILNLLVAKGLVKISIEGKTNVVTETKLGHEHAQKLAENELFASYVKRAKVIKSNFDLNATNLMKFIYATFPEVLTLRANAPIIG
jgi:hypothetical protein